MFHTQQVIVGRQILHPDPDRTHRPDRKILEPAGRITDKHEIPRA
jgi:hypothetical protein